MNIEDLLSEIQDINLSYLMLAQRLLKEDYATARFRLKLDDSMADVLTSASTKQLGQLARTNQFLFRICFESAEQMARLLGKKREQGLTQTHASLLMAGSGNA